MVLRQWWIAGGALLLFVTNMIAIIGASGLVFFLLGFRPAPGDAGRNRVLRRGFRGVVLLLILVTASLVLLTRKSLAEVRLDHEIAAALQREADDVESALNLSLALWKLGRLDEAQAHVAGVIERHARHVPALNRMAELCWALYEVAPEANRVQREAAISYWRRSLEIDRSQSAVEAAVEAAGGGGGNP